MTTVDPGHRDWDIYVKFEVRAQNTIYHASLKC